MIEYRKYKLDNGLTVVTHEAWDTPLATVNVLYGVGSRDEDPQRTGFAHLFEHLMFGGTERVPDFDLVVNSLGGESNAFTNCDYTNYYLTLPVDGLQRALELEADRMLGLDITQRALEVQQRVVTEEYNQRYRNQPYGDAWLLLRPLCYKVYPYRWPTIGADIRHVAEATLDDVRAFHSRWYRPSNAILSVAAPMKHEAMLRLVESGEWRVESGERRVENGELRVESCPGAAASLSTLHSPLSVLHSPLSTYPAEPLQTEARELRVRREVPTPMVYLAWPMCDHADERFRWCDLLSDVLGNGASSRLYSRLVRDEGLMTEADACITGDAGPGLLVLSGKMAPGHSADEGMQALQREAYRLASEGVGDYELQKVVNKYENTFVYSQYKAADRAQALCYYTWLGDTSLVNREPELYRRATPAALLDTARAVIRPEHENRLYYECDDQT